MPYSIRPYCPADAASLSETRWQSVRGLGVNAYTRDQITAWLPERESVSKVRSHFEDGRRAWVICSEDAPDIALGAVDLEADGHIDYLYLRPEVAGRGLAGRLLETAVAAARADHMARLFTEASELARPVFERHGFTATHRRDFDLRGVSIHNYAMVRVLERGGA